MKKIKRFLTMLFMTLTTMSLSTVPVLATDAAPEGGDKFSTDWLKGGDSNGGVFSDLLDKVKSIGKDAYTLVMWIGITVLVIALVVAGILYGISKESGKKSENKDWIVGILIGAIIVGAAMTVIGLVLKVGAGV